MLEDHHSHLALSGLKHLPHDRDRCGGIFLFPRAGGAGIEVVWSLKNEPEYEAETLPQLPELLKHSLTVIDYATNEAKWTEAPMTPLVNDRWEGQFYTSWRRTSNRGLFRGSCQS